MNKSWTQYVYQSIWQYHLPNDGGIWAIIGNIIHTVLHIKQLGYCTHILQGPKLGKVPLHRGDSHGWMLLVGVSHSLHFEHCFCIVVFILAICCGVIAGGAWVIDSPINAQITKYVNSILNTCSLACIRLAFTDINNFKEVNDDL